MQPPPRFVSRVSTGVAEKVIDHGADGWYAVPMRLILLGGGGHASDVFGALEALQRDGGENDDLQVIGFVAEGPLIEDRFAGRNLPFLGRILELAAVGATHFVSCVGYPAGRKK